MRLSRNIDRHAGFLMWEVGRWPNRPMTLPMSAHRYSLKFAIRIFFLTVCVQFGVQAAIPVCRNPVDDFTKLVCTQQGTIPFDQARLFARDNEMVHQKVVLRKILSNPSEVRAWENAVLMAGILGFSEFRPLLQQIVVAPFPINAQSSSKTKPVPASVYRAKREALVSLGILFRTAPTEDRAAIKDFYRAILHDRNWITRVMWRSPFHSNQIQLLRILVAKTFEGMGLTGDTELLDELYHFRDKHSRVLKRLEQPSGEQVRPYRNRGTHTWEFGTTGMSKSGIVTMSPDDLKFLIRRADAAAGSSEFIDGKDHDNGGPLQSISMYYRYLYEFGAPPQARYPIGLRPAELPLLKP